MLLCHHARKGSDAVRQVSAGGQLFVACIVVLMLFSVFSETWELASLEAEFLFSDVAMEFLGGLGLRHWNLIELVLAGAGMAVVLSAITTAGVLAMKSMRSADRQRPDKVPI
jgi:hypothetical protein